MTRKNKVFTANTGVIGTVLDRVSVVSQEILDLIFPPACRFCGERVRQRQEFCRTCHTQLEVTALLMRSGCVRCGHPGASLPRPIESDAIQPGPSQPGPRGCTRCHDAELSFDAVIARWAYRDRVCDAIVACKFAHHASLADALASRLANRVAEIFPEKSIFPEIPLVDASSTGEVSRLPDLVTYVPSHLFRQMTRGGNSNRLFATTLARRLNIPMIECLRVSRPIAKQAWLDDEARKKNVAGAFLLKKSYAWRRSPKLTHRHILLVDDVLTTGATANEVARVLKQAGANRVTLAVTARAIRG